MPRGPRKAKPEKKVTRYTYADIKEPRTPETGHTSLLPAEEQVVTLPMDNGWSKAIEVGKLPEDDKRSIVVDMDPAADPVLFWAGKRNRREIPLLPLQRNEIVSESRIAQIIERVQRTAVERSGVARQGHLFADLEKSLRENDRAKRVEFYTHEEGWKNKLICGDSLHVMESLLHYENLRGKVQMIYIDPPYGINYDSNFQQRVDSTKNDDKDQADDVLTIKAFRDTWALGIHSYLSYLAERLFLSRELLSDTGSIFVQMSDDNVHVVRALMDEVFGTVNYVAQIAFVKTTGLSAKLIDRVYDNLVWYSKDINQVKFCQVYGPQTREMLSQYSRLELENGQFVALTEGQLAGAEPIPKGKRFTIAPLSSQGESTGPTSEPFVFEGTTYRPPPGRHWTVVPEPGLRRLAELGRILLVGKRLCYKRYADDLPVSAYSNIWDDTRHSGFAGAN